MAAAEISPTECPATKAAFLIDKACALSKLVATMSG